MMGVHTDEAYKYTPVDMFGELRDLKDNMQMASNYTLIDAIKRKQKLKTMGLEKPPSLLSPRLNDPEPTRESVAAIEARLRELNEQYPPPKCTGRRPQAGDGSDVPKDVRLDVRLFRFNYFYFYYKFFSLFAPCTRNLFHKKCVTVMSPLLFQK